MAGNRRRTVRLSRVVDIDAALEEAALAKVLVRENKNSDGV